MPWKCMENAALFFVYDTTVWLWNVCKMVYFPNSVRVPTTLLTLLHIGSGLQVDQGVTVQITTYLASFKMYRELWPLKCIEPTCCLLFTATLADREAKSPLITTPHSETLLHSHAATISAYSEIYSTAKDWHSSLNLPNSTKNLEPLDHTGWYWTVASSQIGFSDPYWG